MPQQWEMGQVLSNDQPLIYRQSAPHQVGAGLGLQLAGLDKPLPLLVHNLGWSSSESFLSPRRRTCCKGFPEIGSDFGEGMSRTVPRGYGSRDGYYPDGL
jgi:hypothetical protein